MEIDFSCIYHQNRIAIDKCENCGVYICLECKKVFRDSQTDSRVRDPNFRLQTLRRYPSRLVLCPECYLELNENRYSAHNQITSNFPLTFFIMFFGGFLLLMIFLFTAIGSRESSTTFILLFPILFVGYFVIIILFSIRQFSRKQKFTYKKLIGHNPYQQPRNNSFKYTKGSYDEFDPFCNRCGSKNEHNERFCSNCGMAIEKRL